MSSTEKTKSKEKGSKSDENSKIQIKYHPKESNDTLNP